MATAPPEKPKEDAEDIDDKATGFTDASAAILDSVTKDEWKAIEAALAPARRNVAEMLARVCSQIRMDGEVRSDENNGRFLADLVPEMDTFGVWAYINHIRPRLESLGLKLPEETKEEEKGAKKKGGGKKGGGGKADKISAKVQIKIDNVMRIMAGDLAKGKNSNKQQIGDKPIGWLGALEPDKNLPTDAPWELQLAGEMGAAIAVKKGSYAEIRNLADAITIFETQFKLRFGDKALTKGSLQILLDARHVLLWMKKKAGFTVEECLRKHSHLLSTSQFQARHAAKFLQPYATQLDLYRGLNKPGPRLMLLRSPPDTGKTSLAPALPELFPDKRIVFCCLARRVNLEVGQILYNMGIPFAWVHNNAITTSWLCGLRGASTSPSLAGMQNKIDHGIENLTKNTTRTRKRNVQVIRAPRMFVTDVASCAWLLKQMDPNETVLMLDEPTMGADQSSGEAQPEGSLTAHMVDAMMASPHKAVWCSATLPTQSALPTLVSKFLDVHQVGLEAVSELVSLQLNVGVLLVRPNGQIAMPHCQCTTAANLAEFVEHLKTEPLLLKAYTAQAVVSMQDALRREEVVAAVKKAGFKIEDLETTFHDVSALTHASLRTYAIQILENMVACQGDELVATFCKPVDEPEASETPYPAFDADKLLLDNAWCFPGMSLTVSNNPLQQIDKTAQSLIEEMPDLSKLAKEIEAKEEEEEKRLATIRKEAEKAAKGAGDKADDIMADRMRDVNIETGQSTLNIPAHCVLNTKQHMKKYAPKGAHTKFDWSFFRKMPSQEDFKRVEVLPVTDKWRMLLLSGVAAHMPYDPDLNPKGNTTYTQYVGEQLEKGAMALCGVTKDFTYGANVPCTSVLIDKAFTDQHSANTIRQFIGRVARTGLAPFGVAQFEDDAALGKLFARNDNTEAEVMEATSKSRMVGPS